MENIKIVIDAFGGDNAPVEIVEGAVLAVKKIKNLTVILTGDKERILEILAGRVERIEILDAKEVIRNDESPTGAIRNKPDSSLVKAFDALRHNTDVIALISAGSTGSLLAGAVMKIGRIKGVSRPSLAPILPTKKSNVTLIDSGSNIDCKPEQLCQFAVMGSAYHKIVFGIDKPKVALLNIGTEEGKGNELVKLTLPLMKKLPINFVGNMEGRDYLSGDYDVVVTDGFAGNVLLKSTEGAVEVMLSIIKKHIKAGFWAKIGYALFLKPTFNTIRGKLDIKKHGGSPFLGCKKLVLKNHGSSLRSNILASVEHAIVLHENKLIEKIEQLING